MRNCCNNLPCSLEYLPFFEASNAWKCLYSILEVSLGIEFSLSSLKAGPFVFFLHSWPLRVHIHFYAWAIARDQVISICSLFSSLCLCYFCLFVGQNFIACYFFHSLETLIPQLDNKVEILGVGRVVKISYKRLKPSSRIFLASDDS